MDDIDDWRKKIDEIDLKLVKLLNQRGQCAIEIGKIKEKLKLRIYDPQREEDVAGNVQAAANGPLSREAVRRLFERIIDESRRAERESRKARGSRKTRKIRKTTEGAKARKRRKTKAKRAK